MPQAAVDGWTTGPAWRIRFVSLPSPQSPPQKLPTWRPSSRALEPTRRPSEGRACGEGPSASPSPSEGVPHIEGEGFLVENEGKYADENEDEEDVEEEEEKEIAHFDEASE